MLLLILSIILIALSVAERFVFIKKDKSWNRLRLLIGLMMILVLFFISYFITDTTIGIIYLFLGMGFYFIMGIIDSRSDVENLKCIGNLVGLPIMVLLFIKMRQHLLIDFQYIIIITILVNAILAYSYKRKRTKKENISFAIGALLVIIMMYSYFNLTDIEDRLKLKQVSVAEKYLEEELNMQDVYVYMRSFGGRLRGKESIVRAYDREGNTILMIYRNNKIVSHEVKD